MVFCALHLDRAEDLLAQEEVYLVLPGGGAKTALAVPLDALPEFLPLLERAVGGGALPALHRLHRRDPAARVRRRSLPERGSGVDRLFCRDMRPRNFRQEL